MSLIADRRRSLSLSPAHGYTFSFSPQPSAALSPQQPSALSPQPSAASNMSLLHDNCLAQYCKRRHCPAFLAASLAGLRHSSLLTPCSSTAPPLHAPPATPLPPAAVPPTPPPSRSHLSATCSSAAQTLQNLPCVPLFYTSY